ncbi:hypothetical protein BOX15_Mlig009246g1 [Macrostomum lignano]|uniref:Uncharacterized protein n=1 Tax=Macrostomum lignano TaxID=282301 RepID=A0A267EDR8_9PLAT|nr:hypothetical protein BOX15_Mlig009246g1 [Macrostomum lignano]
MDDFNNDSWRWLLSRSERDNESIYDWSRPEIFQYEAKRAGTSRNNSNTVSGGGIRDVQVHKSKSGKETRVETELQSSGMATDLNINIIMDSDSNMSNVVGNSLEYESLDQQRPSDETPTPVSEEGGGADGGGSAGGAKPGDEGGGAEGGGGLTSEWAAVPNLGGEQLSESSSEHGEVIEAAGAEPSGQPMESDDDVDDGGDEEEGEGDMDDAMRHFQRYLDGEKIDALRGPSKDDDAKDTLKKLPTGHLEKEGVVIGCMSVFADVHIKEFIVMLSDDMIQAFLVDPERFRSVANRTKCEIEVTRRILNRRMGKYRWLKYLVVIIRGPSYSSIDQCDKMMSLLFPPYKWRKPYGAPAAVSMFLKENTPDNTDLYFNYQRTGPCQRMFGEISLRAPFRKTKSRPVEQTPWKMVQKRQQWGVLEPKNDRMERLLNHVYPERGGSTSQAMDQNIKWADAAVQAVEMSKARDLARSQMLQSRRLESEPLYARAVGE